MAFTLANPGNVRRCANAQFHTNIESGKNRESGIEHSENVIRFLEQRDGEKAFFVFLALSAFHTIVAGRRLSFGSSMTREKSACQRTLSLNILR